MTQTYFNLKPVKGTHLCYQERVPIETLKTLGFSNRAIARELNRAPQTIHNEIQRGTTRQIKHQKPQSKVYEYETFLYIPSLAHQRYIENRKCCGAKGIWAKNPEFIPWADQMMDQCKWSPGAVIGYAHRNNVFDDAMVPSTTTLYAWINEGKTKTKNINLLEKLRRKKKSKTSYHRANKRILGPSISTRPSEIDRRQSFGHWEIDTVIGTKDQTKPVILTLVERLTRFEKLILIESKSAEAVSQTLSHLMGQLGDMSFDIFKSITSDNGSEFALLHDNFKDPFDVFFTHPFASFERGTSENQHKMIRRFIPKGVAFSPSHAQLIPKIQQYMNDYPRDILGYQTAHESMAIELKKLNLF